MSEQEPKPSIPNESIPPPLVVNPPISVPPPLGSNDVIRTKRNTRSSSNDAKLSIKNKKEDDVSEDMEVKDEILEVNDKCSEASMGSGSQGMTELDGGSNSAASAHDKSQVCSMVDKPNDNIGTSGELKCSLNANVPSVDNPVLNPGANVANSSGNVSSMGNKGMGNTNNVWPSLMETLQTGMCSSLGVGSNSDSKDIEMQDSTNGMKFGSFVKAVQGVNNTGNNRLSLKPLRINEFGNPIIMDRITTQMCDKGYGRASYARVLVVIDVAKGLVENVEICYNSLGRSMGLRVEYTWRPPVCSHCKVFGHDFVNCVNRVLTEEEIKENGVSKNEKRNVGLKSVNPEKKNEIWQEVNGRNYVRSSWGPDRGYYQQNEVHSNVNRGGFNGRGRGSFNSIGGGAQRMNNGGRNTNMQPLPTKNKEVNTVGSHEEVDGKSKDIGNVGNGADEKCVSKEKGKKINELKSKISKLQKDISYRNRNVVMTAKNKADKLCNMACEGKKKVEVEFFVETEQVMTEEVKRTWSEEMLDMYEAYLEKKVENLIDENFDEGILDKMEDEVAEETHGNDNFMTQMVVSNGIESYSNQMQGESITKDPNIGLKSRIGKLQKNLVLSIQNLHGNAKKIAEQRIIDERDGKRDQSSYNLFYSQAYDVELESIKQMKW
ncbi:hypothetical protein CTI12_AA361750 [Artemisia annua]|uniref:Zinc knuckle CX2CX4HX4C n=1 Tax=Artemisia annua TaxID=35608 RepID=A0A2U1ML75_ARTAN|nr:hypothetical protein CTI12_AA361750 [Artemisia annua]